jgi:dual specificity phosphatase 12
MPVRSKSTRTAGPPSDAAKPDDKAINDVYKSVQETGSLELAALKLQKYAAQRTWEDDPEEAGYIAALAADDVEMDEDEEENVMEGQREVVHLQEVLPGLWIGDLVAAMDMPGLAERGIVSVAFPSHFHLLGSSDISWS